MKNRRRPPPPQRGTKTTRLRLTLRLKDDTLQRPTQEDIFEITHTKLECFLTGIRDINNGGFSVTSDMQSTIDSLVSPKGRQELAKIKLAPVPSPKITAERTVFISRLSRHVGDLPAIEIQNEIIRVNPNINNIQVHKIKHYYHFIKVVCEDTETADAVNRDGLYAFHTKIAASQCKKEQYTELKTCFRCYKFEEHFSSDCKATQIICSECAQVGHTHRDCHAVEKRCINCPPRQNLHRTLAPFCPVRKEAIAQKQQKLQNANEIQNNQTYANIVKTTIKETTPPTKPVINLTQKHHLKYVILILEAHKASIGDWRPYNVILQESLKANNIDAVIPNRDSQKIMDIYSNLKQKQKDHVPEEFLCESSSSSDESSDEEELQPPQTEDEAAPPLTLEQSDNQKNGKGRKIPTINISPL